MKATGAIFIILILCLSGCHHNAPMRFELPRDADLVLQFALSQYVRAVESLTDTTRMPVQARADGSWVQKPTSDWVSGFFAGILWYLYDYSKDPFWEKQARRWNAALEQEKFNTSTHDLGFMLYNSFGNGFRLTEDPNYREILIQGAESLISRFNPIVGTIKSWDAPPEDHLTIIDNMMNLEYLMWTSKVTGDPKYRNIAIRHADVTLNYFFRSDGSSWHVVNFDPHTGAVKEKKTAQGYGNESSWARGQAWGGYGFTMMYRETGEQRYLDAAQKTMDRFIERLPADRIPYWDFDAPKIPNEPKESSAAAIAASALLELSTLVKDTNQKEHYYRAAVEILNRLANEPYLAHSGQYQCLLLHSNASVPAKVDVDANFTYADYYFIEALLRLLRYH
ncbi:MAG: glycoside hydrolase family 88 protein [candidate division KSB1 bacterium]|nr:glycoside hydrolase family 88 protein [candidate division KSB1 bacterium]MDZ7358472.1 glycoside hydrolase family 88 protein [candidate division KSB1 bacterium]